MFWVHVAKEKDIPAIKALIEKYNLLELNQANLTNYMVGEFEGEVVSLAAFEVYEDSALLHSLVVKEEHRNKYFGDTTARAMINLADRRFIRYIYKGINDLNQGYFLARMRYRPIAKEELNHKLLQDYDYTEVWKLDLIDFFNHSCNCNH